ncbi:MAG: hypothetical protein JWM11_4080 [Planctomycetaceae bacterium]|nr:hypothetical protein [Planctomycetaceae bacterium]
MWSTAAICLLMASTSVANDINAPLLAARNAAMERSVTRFEIAGERRVGTFPLQLSGDENTTMNWSILSSVPPEFGSAHPFISERDFTTGTLYYCSDANSDTWQEYHASQGKCVLFHHNLNPGFPTVMLKEGLFDQCRDDASPARWDLRWLKPINGASISEALLQTQDEATTVLWPGEERFRVNSVKGVAGKRIVDVSLVYLHTWHKTLNRHEKVSVEGYRLLLAEAHEFMPIVLCHTSPIFTDKKRGKIIDGLVTTVLTYEDFRNVDGIPVPHVLNAYSTPFRGTVTTVRTELLNLKLNKLAKVRDQFEIPVGAWVVDTIQGKSYRQGKQE